VRVLEEKQVGGHDAVVLEADSATALSGWPKKHGYVERPTLTEWLRPYVAQKWKLTAFKIAASEPVQAISTSAVPSYSDSISVPLELVAVAVVFLVVRAVRKKKAMTSRITPKLDSGAKRE
jgi:hypothetical protein